MANGKALQQLRYEFVRKIAMTVAEVYAEFLYPAPFDEVFYPGGRRFRVTVTEYHTKDDTQPVMRSET